MGYSRIVTKPRWQQPVFRWDLLSHNTLKLVTVEECEDAAKDGYRAIIEDGKVVGFRYEPPLSRASVDIVEVDE